MCVCMYVEYVCTVAGCVGIYVLFVSWYFQKAPKNVNINPHSKYPKSTADTIKNAEDVANSTVLVVGWLGIQVYAGSCGLKG